MTEIMCCAYCKNWMLGTYDPAKRVEAKLSNEQKQCRIWKKKRTSEMLLDATDHCVYYDEVLMRGMKV